MKKLLTTFLIMFTCMSYAQPSFLVYNSSQDKEIYAQNIHQVRPLASITKLMTAMVALDNDKDLSKQHMLTGRVGGTLPRQRYTRYQLLNAMLVRSDNAAAETLAENYPGGRKAFILAMNEMAVMFGLQHTKFEDPTGLSYNNTSTASDVALLVEAAAGHWVIREISVKRHLEFQTQTKQKKHIIRLQNTNSPILFEFDDIITSKTGYTGRAGWCLAMAVEKDGQQLMVVILGAPNKLERIRTAEYLMNNYVQRDQTIKVPALLLGHPDYLQLTYKQGKFFNR